MSLYDSPIDPFASPPPPPRRLDDAAVPYERLDVLVPLGSRWPDWRWLLRTDTLHLPGLPPLVIDDLDPAGLVGVLAVVYEHADAFHVQAAEDEEAAVSSALAWAFQELRVPHVRTCTATAWLHATPLVRYVHARLRGHGPSE